MAAAYGHTKAGPFRSMLRTPGQRREEREIRALAEERLAFFGERLMGYRWDQPAYSLSYANRRRLEIARATATRPRLLLLDEPAAGMNPRETQEITELIGELRTKGGYTILVIEHDMRPGWCSRTTRRASAPKARTSAAISAQSSPTGRTYGSVDVVCTRGTGSS